ncbi:HEAT repeat domain-containing protein [Desulfogranum marinum]|uniref:HEAT repeat domain-containing protein n=1 Tax=Desulfogranum marinum TaxID=453220 RepID=UPI0029C81A2B|nr:HEAT repeat domain-containing protein [Desulfogranum marinum]
MFTFIHILNKDYFLIKRILLFTWWFSLCSLAPPSSLFGATFDLQLQDNRLSIQAKNYPLEEALKEIASRAEFKLVIYGTLSSTVDIEFHNSPLESALRRIVGKHPMVVLFEQIDALDQIKEVWIFQQGGEERSMAEASAEERTSGYTVPRTVFIHNQTSHEIEVNPAEEDYYDISRLQRAILQEEDTNKLELTVRELAAIGNDESVQVMAQVLEKPDPGLRSYVAEQLGQIDTLNAVLVLGQIVLGEKDPAVRLEAVKSLAGKDSVPAKAFLQTATQDKDGVIRKTAANAL